jgi:beta-galactosidase
MILRVEAQYKVLFLAVLKHKNYKIMKKTSWIWAFVALFCSTYLPIQAQRIIIPLDADWRFSLGDASDMKKDFGHGTEYFTYIAKVQATLQTKSPIWTGFDDKSWQQVNLPHDWVVDLPFSKEASHSHGYKMVGWKYPQNSIGWYRKHFSISKSDLGKHISIQFDGIYRNAQVFCNGFFLGQEPSGYATQVYDLTDYLNYGGDNVITVRADASLEEGWFYEGAGIYRHVWLCEMGKTHIRPFGTAVVTDLTNNYQHATIHIVSNIMNDGPESESVYILTTLKNKEGKIVATNKSATVPLLSRATKKLDVTLQVTSPELWSVDTPYLYSLTTEVYCGEKLTDNETTPIGIRSICFDPNKGFLLNGLPVKIKGTNLHQDHAGVGVAIPDELWAYRIQKLKDMGSNAIRSSHNPASPAMLDLCDKVGMLVLDENRSMGINEAQLGELRRMIERDRNHPSVILWSLGNEEWAIEGNEMGERITRTMTEYVHRIDSTRPTTAGNSGGQILINGLDVKGYNYIAQNDIDGLHQRHPEWRAVGTEETSGCGTRNVYYTDSIKRWMAPLNRTIKDGVINIIERGWKYYLERPWLGGLFYWTGFDYRGEPNPMVYPATGSQFGILDYCGFPKDEAYYLKAWWTDQPVLHIAPHWNLKGHEGETIKLWAYSNCDEIELFANGKSLGKQKMPKYGHLEWEAIYQPGYLLAQGYKNGKKSICEKIETTGEAVQTKMTAHQLNIKADGADLSIINISLADKKGREVPDAKNQMNISIQGPAIILGYGNGDPGFKEIERPISTEKSELDIKAFSGKAQVLIQSIKGQKGEIIITLKGNGLKTTTLKIKST